MPNSVCCVTGCGRKYSVSSKGNNPRFFGIPTVLEHLPDVTKARRSEWLKRLNLKESEVDVETKVCDAHFESGKPSYVLMHEDVDWAPNKQLGSVGEQVVNRKKRHAIISSKRMAQPIIKPSKKKRTPTGVAERNGNVSNQQIPDPLLQQKNSTECLPTQEEQGVVYSRKKCAVVGCNRKRASKQKDGEDTPTFHAIPKLKHDKYDMEISKARRTEWLQRLELKESEVTPQTVICNAHFQSGAPSYFRCKADVDWAPSLFLSKKGEYIAKKHILWIKNTNRAKANQTPVQTALTPAASSTLDHNYFNNISEHQDATREKISLLRSLNLQKNENIEIIAPRKQKSSLPHFVLGNKMCCVKGCCKPESYCRTLFQVPMAKSLSADSFDDPLAVKRRSAWLKAIDIQTFVDMDRANTLPLLFVCSDHFQSKKPAEFYQQDHVDWVPSLLMGKKLNNAPKGSAQEMEIDPLSLVEVTMSVEKEPSIPPVSLPPPTQALSDILVIPSNNGPTATSNNDAEVERLKILLANKTLALEKSELELALVKSTAENEKLKRQLAVETVAVKKGEQEILGLKRKMIEMEAKYKIDERRVLRDHVISALRDDDIKTRFYTGLKTWSLFITVFELVLKPEERFDQQVNRKLSLQQELLATLMRLRLNLKLSDIGYRFHVPGNGSSIARVVYKWIDLLFNRLPGSSFAPDELENIEGDCEARMKKLRKRLKNTYTILEGDSYSEDDVRDKDGISFLDKVSIVCECLLNMNDNVG